MRSLSVFALAILVTSASAQQYRLVDLGARSAATTIAADGRTIGIDQTGPLGGRAVVWSADGTSRAALAGFAGRPVIVSAASGAGLIVGYGTRNNGSGGYAVRWKNGGAPDAFLGEAYNSGAYGVNAAGTIVGERQVNGNTIPFLWTETGGVQDIPLPGGLNNGIATAISDSGRVFGYASLNGITSDGALWTWTAAEGTTFMQNIRNDSGRIYSANAAGAAVGQVAEGSRAGDAVLWDAAGNPTQIFMGTVGSQALGINARGDVVGSWREGDGFDHARLRTAGGAEFRLSDFTTGDDAWFLEVATGINDRGEIAGYGNFNGSTHAFKLVPVPEPATLLVLGGGLTALARRRRRAS